MGIPCEHPSIAIAFIVSVISSLSHILGTMRASLHLLPCFVEEERSRS
ncbi:hypothetical protein SDJN02_21724, partial [Cucurbita argyrosperma subsp. argyrosperma]